MLVGTTHEEKNEKEICCNMHFVGNNTNRTADRTGGKRWSSTWKYRKNIYKEVR